MLKSKIKRKELCYVKNLYKGKALKVVIQLVFLRACCKNKSKDYFTGRVEWENGRVRGEKQQQKSTEKKQKRSKVRRGSKERACLSVFMTCNRRTEKEGSADSVTPSVI